MPRALLILVLLLFPVGTFAQPPKTRPQNPPTETRPAQPKPISDKDAAAIWNTFLAIIICSWLTLVSLPITIAYFRGHPQIGIITVLTVITTITGIGWIAVMVWACLPFKQAYQKQREAREIEAEEDEYEERRRRRRDNDRDRGRRRHRDDDDDDHDDDRDDDRRDDDRRRDEPPRRKEPPKPGGGPENDFKF